MLKGIFFDLYGTLYKYGNMPKAWDDWLDTLYLNFRIFDKNLTKDSLSNACEGFFSKDEPVEDGSGLSLFERRIKRLAQELSYNIPDETIKKTATENLNAWHNYITLDEQTIPLLESLKDRFVLGLVSNFDHPEHVKNLLAADKIDKYFSSIVISGEVGFKKPDKRIFDITLQNTNLLSEEVLFVGDSNDDIQGAKSAGIVPIHIKRDSESVNMLDYNKIEDKEEHNNNGLLVISHLDQLIKIIDGKNNETE